MAKVDVLPGQKWSAHAALHAAIENVGPQDKVFIIIERIKPKENEASHGYFSANLTFGECIFL